MSEQQNTTKTVARKDAPRVRVGVTVAVYRTDRSFSSEQCTFRDELTYDEWDVRGLGRVLRRVRRAIEAERRIATKKSGGV